MAPPKLPNDKSSPREAKLAQALRANLRRRKAGDKAASAKPAPKEDGER